MYHMVQNFDRENYDKLGLGKLWWVKVWWIGSSLHTKSCWRKNLNSWITKNLSTLSILSLVKILCHTVFHSLQLPLESILYVTVWAKTSHVCTITEIYFTGPAYSPHSITAHGQCLYWPMSTGLLFWRAYCWPCKTTTVWYRPTVATFSYLTHHYLNCEI